MNNDHYRKRLRDLAQSDQFHFDLFEQIKEKHNQLVRDEPNYKKTNECFFMEEFLLGENGDKAVLNYLRCELLDNEPEDWNE